MIPIEKPKYHLINELPHIYELEDMMEFCKKTKELYIYGYGERQEYLCKYLEMCGIIVKGYVTSWGKDNHLFNFIYKEFPVLCIEDAIKIDGIGIILGLSDRYYDYVIPKLRELKFEHYFMMSEWNKNAVAYQVKPRTKDLMGFGISLVDHCNLSCQMCDHYAQLSEPWFVDMEHFEKDMIRMGKLFDHEIGAVVLEGGEPTLHPKVMKCMEITRREFPKGEIIIITNGIKLLELEHSDNGNFWEICRKCNIHIIVTMYPIKNNYEEIEKKAKEYGVFLTMSSEIHEKNDVKNVKISYKHTMNLTGSIDKFYCISCLYFNKYAVLKEGHFYMCPIEAHSDIFNKAFNKNLKLRDGDYLDIYKIDSWEELAEFTCQYSPFCSYCDLKNWGPYKEWQSSTKEISEYV